MAPRDTSYDVAISFLSQDEPRALAIENRLSENWEVFVFTQRQEDIAGADGVEVLRSIFRRDARMVVVLHRDTWGETDWTNLEEEATEERILDSDLGSDTVFLIKLDDAQPPNWLRENRIWSSADQYGIEGAVAAIDSRLEELGLERRSESPIEVAERLQTEAEWKQHRDRILRSKDGVQVAREELETIYGRLNEVAEQMPLQVTISRDRPDGYTFAASTGSVAFSLGWSARYRDSVRDSSLFYREYPHAYNVNPNSVIMRENAGTEYPFLFTLTRDGNPGWYRKGRQDRVFTSQELVDRLLTKLLKRHYAT